MEWKYRTQRRLDLEGALNQLRKKETSPIDETDRFRTDTVRVASVTQVKDELSCGRPTVGETNWRHWGVYDDHSGWATSSVLPDLLSQYVHKKIEKLSTGVLKDSEKVGAAIKSAFIQLENEIISDAHSAIYEPVPHAEGMCRIAPATSGSCALLALNDEEHSTLYVAGAGDSRIVLGRQKCDDKSRWVSIPLSVAHRALNLYEVARINAEHPGEYELFDEDRMPGYQITRTSGDHRVKWSAEALEDWKKGNVSTIPIPPYVTTEPDVKNIHVQPVHCVNLWIEQHKAAPDASDQAKTQTLEDLSVSAENCDKHVEGIEATGTLRESLLEESTDNTECANVRPLSPDKNLVQPMYPHNWAIEKDHFIVEHGNAATNLVRNAFGGKLHDLCCGVMSVKSSDSKQARDDVTAIVIFF